MLERKFVDYIDKYSLQKSSLITYCYCDKINNPNGPKSSIPSALRIGILRQHAEIHAYFFFIPRRVSEKPLSGHATHQFKIA